MLDRTSILIKIINMKNASIPDGFTMTSAEACAVLGISAATLYAYVSRGLVRAIAQPGDARKSLYDRRDVAALEGRKKRGRSRRSVAESTIDWGEPVLTSKITRIADGGFFYRGHNAVEVAETATLEETAQIVAGLRMKPVRHSSPVTDCCKDESPFNRILATMANAALSPPRNDGRPHAARLLHLAATSAAGGSIFGELPIHDGLARAWSDDPDASNPIRTALVLCADHELNASTYAARVAASAGASVAASLLAGLATLSGTRHGGLTPRCQDWMKDVERTGLRIESDGSAAPYSLPGFGHPLYPEGDPRPAAIFKTCPLTPDWVRRLEVLRRDHGQMPNLDFGLAWLERSLHLPKGAGLAIFAVGRTVGWIAHIFEQRESGKLIRPRAAP